MSQDGHSVEPTNMVVIIGHSNFTLFVFVDDEAVAFIIGEFDGLDVFESCQCLHHLDWVMGLSHASEVDVSVTEVEFEVLCGSIP